MRRLGPYVGAAVGGGRRCSAGDAGEEGRRARLRRVVRAEEQNHLGAWRRAESNYRSVHLDPILCRLIRSCEFWAKSLSTFAIVREWEEIMHMLTDLKRIKHSLDLVLVLVR